MPNNLEGKVAIVIGAGRLRGIGSLLFALAPAGISEDHPLRCTAKMAGCPSNFPYFVSIF